MEGQKELSEKDKICYEKFMHAADVGLDEVAMVLRCHLLVEYYLDHIIIANIPRGDILLDHKFTLSQKVIIVESLDILLKELCDSIKNLNTVRNNCAHDLDYKITESDIDKIGRSYGKKYLAIKNEHSHKIKELLHWTLAFPIIGIQGAVERRGQGVLPPA